MQHIKDYDDRLAFGAWVGVGSVCKRNSNIREIGAILRAIKQVRPDFRLHSFGVKTTSLHNPEIRSLLASADSMAWSFAARKAGRNQNDWHEAAAFAEQQRTPPSALPLPLESYWSDDKADD